jgi:phage-related protein
MPILGPGVSEIRIHAGGEIRVLYVARFRRAIYVLHVFNKRTRKTPKAAVGVGRARYQEVLRMEAVNK